MATPSAILKYLVSVLVCYVLLAMPSHGIYIKDRSSRQRGDRSRGRDADGETSVEERRREPFSRTLVLCEADRECPYKYYCHSGEGHKSCLKCRKSHRRCHRNKMCCAGNTCVEGRCIPHQFRFDETYNTAVQNLESEVDPVEESFIQDTKFNLRKARQGEQCSSSVECDDGLCCAQHLWSKMCKPMLEEGDICTKKRDRLTDVFQRCECSAGLSCKRDAVPDRRLHVCQPIKQRSSGTSTEEERNADAAEGALSQRERILSLPVEKIRPIPSKNDGDLLEYLSAESGEKLFDLAARGERWMLSHGRSPSKLKGTTTYRDTTEITRTEQADIEASQLTVL